jgi:hypothetical protein
MSATRTHKTSTFALSAILAAVTLGSFLTPVQAQADGGCIPGDAPGSVPRNARPGDMVCVPPQTADLVQQEAATAAERVDPNGAYGPQSCKSGFVWREAFDGDTVCVTPARRQATWQQNANAGVGATGGLAPQPSAKACEWKYIGTSVLELSNGNLVEMRFGGLSATGPLRMVVKDRFGSLTVFRGELYSGHTDDKLGETFCGIIWLNNDDSRAGGYDFTGKIDPGSGTLSGTYEIHEGGTGQWKAREHWTCGQ